MSAPMPSHVAIAGDYQLWRKYIGPYRRTSRAEFARLPSLARVRMLVSVYGPQDFRRDPGVVPRRNP